MAKVVRVCKNCGKEYEACRTARYQNAFRWQDVACSPECGAAYFAAVLAARSNTMTERHEPEYRAMSDSDFDFLYGDEEDDIFDFDPDDESDDEFID